MGVGTLRRHYRNKVLAREFPSEDATAMVYQAKADAIAGFALPVKFVSAKIRQKLVDVGLTTLDDLNGATVAEVAERTGLNKMEAGKVVKAVEREVALRADDKLVLLADYPYQAALAAHGYTTEESIADLDEAELAEIPDVGEVGARVIQAHREGLLGVPFAENYPHMIRLGELGIRAEEQLARYDAADLVRFGMTEQEALEVIEFRDHGRVTLQTVDEGGNTITTEVIDPPPPLESDANLPISQQQPAGPTTDPTATVGTEGENASQVST